MDYKAEIYNRQIEKFKKLSFNKLIKDHEFKLYLGSLGFYTGKPENIFGIKGKIDLKTSYWTKTRWKIKKLKNKNYILSPAFYEEEEIQARFALRFEKGKLELRIYAETLKKVKILDRIGCYKILIDYSMEGEKIKSEKIELSMWDELSVTISNLDAFFWEPTPLYESFDLNIIHQAFIILIDNGFATDKLLQIRCNEILEIINNLIDEEEQYEAQLYIQIKALLDYSDIEGDWFEQLYYKFNIITYLYKIYHNEDDEIKFKIKYLIEKKANEGILYSVLESFDISNVNIMKQIFWFFGLISRKTILFFEKTLDFEDRELMDKIITILLQIDYITGYLLLFKNFSQLKIEFKLRILNKIESSFSKIRYNFNGLTPEEIYQFERISAELGELLEQEKELTIKIKIIEILGNIGIKNINSLLTNLDDLASCIRAKAAEALGKIGNPKAFRPLIMCLKDDSLEVQFKVIEALGKIGNPLAVKPLIRKLSSENKNIVWNTIISLGKLSDEQAAKPLVPFLNNPNPKIRLKTLDALDKIGDPSVIPDILKTLDDDDPNIRAKSTEILGLLGDKQISSHLINKLNDIKIVKLEAIRALGFLREDKALDRLLKLLKSEPINIKKEIILSLGKIRDKKAITPILELSTEKELRGTILWALSEIEDDIRIKLQIKRLQTNDLNLKIDVLNKLDKINSDKIIPPLKVCLYDANEKISLKAEEILKRKKFLIRE